MCDLVGDQQFIEINFFKRVTRRRLWITCAATLIVEVDGEVFSDGDLLKLDCEKYDTPASENKQVAGYQFWEKLPTSATISPTNKTSQNSLPKTKDPAGLDQRGTK